MSLPLRQLLHLLQHSLGKFRSAWVFVWVPLQLESTPQAHALLTGGAGQGFQLDRCEALGKALVAVRCDSIVAAGRPLASASIKLRAQLLKFRFIRLRLPPQSRRLAFRCGMRLPKSSGFLAKRHELMCRCTVGGNLRSSEPRVIHIELCPGEPPLVIRITATR